MLDHSFICYWCFTIFFTENDFDTCEALEEEPMEHIDMSTFSGNLRHDDSDNGRDCWTISDGKNFRVRGKNFCTDKTKVLIALFLQYVLGFRVMFLGLYKNVIRCM